MTFRLTTIIFFALLAFGCNNEAQSTTTKSAPNAATLSVVDIENTFTTFSNAVSKKNSPLLQTVSDKRGIHLVRLFTSGNLGGRGASLSEVFNPAKMNNDLEFPITKQTPFNLPIIFPSIATSSFKTLPRRTLSSDIESIPYDQWVKPLKASLNNTPESDSGDPAVLSTLSSNYWVYAEAQIIDDALVGGFAVFAVRNDGLKLVAVIELL